MAVKLYINMLSLYGNKVESKKKQHTVGTVPKSNREIVEIGQTDTLNRSPLGLVHSTSINRSSSS
jgi:hypothetical protein